jgi:hypothetical protein
MTVRSNASTRYGTTTIIMEGEKEKRQAFVYGKTRRTTSVKQIVYHAPESFVLA